MVNGLVNFDINPSVVQTTDDSTLTTILTVSAFGTTDDGSQLVTLDITGFDFSNGEMVSAKIAVKLQQVSGTPEIVGSPVHLIPINAGSSTALSTASIVPTIDGTNLKVNVYGVAGRTIDWTCVRNNSLQLLENLTATSAIEDGYLIRWDGTDERWQAVSQNSAINGATVGGDLSGTLPNPTVININGASVPASGSLVTGNVLQVNGSSSLTYGPINLAGGANYVTGVLPASNQAAQTLTGDVTGTTASTLVASATGTVVDGYDTVYVGDSTHSFRFLKTAPTTTGSQDLMYEAAGGSAGGSIWLIPGNGSVGADGSIILGRTYGSGAPRQCQEIQLDSAVLRIINPNTGTTATGGSASALPSFPVGYLILYFGGSGGEFPIRIPYYNA